MTANSPTTLYDVVGGDQFFLDLVDLFYVRVEQDDLLRPLYPPDLTDSKLDLAQFLAQYWGGPQIYSSRKGHPRLRMRHNRFAIRTAEKDAWLAAMGGAVDEIEATDDVKARLREYFDMAATHLINAPDPD